MIYDEIIYYKLNFLFLDAIEEGSLIVLGVAAFFFVTELIPLAVTAMGASIALGLLGVLTPKQVFSGLSNSTVVLFAGMFVIGAAMFQTGLAQRIGITVVHAAGTGEKRLMAAIMIVTIILSSVSSNTATVACLLPVVVQICAVARLAVSPQLMALAVAANVGGTITMIGTPPNILMSATLSASGLQPFGFFEFAWIGIPLSIAGVIYMLTIGRRLCPHGHVDSNLSDLTSDLPKDTRKMTICAIILILVVIAMALSKTINVPMQTAAIIGALACVITGCLTEKQAYGGIDWTTIFLFAGMLPLAEAMDKTGAGAMIANGVVGIIGSNASPLIIVMAMFLLSCGLTQFMSNTAAAALLAPIGISIAQSIGVSPFPVLMAIGIAASCAFTTPVATPPNTLILGPGKFRFMDYVKVGLPLVVVSMIVCTVIIPLVWPF